MLGVYLVDHLQTDWQAVECMLFLLAVQSIERQPGRYNKYTVIQTEETFHVHRYNLQVQASQTFACASCPQGFQSSCPRTIPIACRVFCFFIKLATLFRSLLFFFSISSFSPITFPFCAAGARLDELSAVVLFSRVIKWYIRA